MMSVIKNNIYHDKNYDAKNMMHTFRLLHIAEDIAKNNNITVRVSPSEREYLFKIKNAMFEYDDLVKEAEEIRDQLEALYEVSALPEKPNLNLINELLVDIRNKFYLDKK